MGIERVPLSVAFAVLAPLCWAGCGGSEPGPSDPAGAAGTATSCEAFEPSTIDVGAEPSALVFDAASGTLYVVDDESNRVVSWREGEMTVVGGIAHPQGDPAADGLGEVALAADGTLLVPRYGYGDDSLGAVFRLRPGEVAERIPGLATGVRRIGAALDPSSGELLVAAHIKQGVESAGRVDRIDIVAGGETTLASGLRKPTGVAVVGGKAMIAEPGDGVVYSVDLAAPAAPVPFATGIPRVDRLAPADAGGLWATASDEAGERGLVVHIDATGAHRVIAEGAWTPRGIAWDPAGRVFLSTRGASVVQILSPCAADP